MDKKNELARVRAEVERKVRADLERERAQVAKPIFQGLTQWIQTTAWWKLVLFYVMTWPLSLLEGGFGELIGLLPGGTILIDGVLLHAIDEFIFLTLPVLLLLELWRRAYWTIRGAIMWILGERTPKN